MQYQTIGVKQSLKRQSGNAHLPCAWLIIEGHLLAEPRDLAFPVMPRLASLF